MQNFDKEAEREAERARAEERRREAVEWQRRMDNIAKKMGGFVNDCCFELQEEFVAAIAESKRIGDIVVDNVEHFLIRGDYEADIVARNDGVVVVGEVRCEYDRWDVARFAEGRLPRFVEMCPDIAKNRKVLGMVGGNLITKAAEKEAEKHGLIILRLKNKKVIAKNVKSARPIAPAH